jgi:thioredoxin-like negative regulator of GroEL
MLRPLGRNLEDPMRCSVVRSGVMTRPRLFRHLTLEQARSTAQAERKMLLIDVMGDWCPPCRVMDETTWRAPDVEAWVAEHAVAIQIDSADPSVKSFAIKAIPTLMLFRDDTLLDRVVGGRSAEDLLGWLARAARGEKEAPSLVEVQPDDIHGRRQRVSVLLEQGRIEEATDELAWIWEHALEVGEHWIGVRHSYVVKEISELVNAHATARARFAAIRDRTEQRLPAADAIRDWVDLNRALGDDDRTLGWIARSADDPARRVPVEANMMLFELLVRRSRWEDLGRLIEDPVKAIERDHEGLEKIIQFHAQNPDPRMISAFQTMFRGKAASICHALRAAGRANEAEATVVRARALDPSDEMNKALNSITPPTTTLPNS